MKLILNIYIKTAYLLICSFLLSISLYSRNFDTDSLDNSNSLNLTDSISAENNLSKDSVIYYRFNNFHGSLDYKLNSTKINKKNIQEINYLDINDIIAHSTNSFLINLGFNSTPSLLYNYGFSNSQNYLLNGAANLINNERFNLINMFSPENFENIELFSGSSAILRSDNSNGYLINIIEINHNTSAPFTRLWLSESAGGIIGVDGIYSQNILPNLGLTVGFKNMNADGIYTNSAVKNLNFRTKLSYFISDSSTLSLSYNFYNLFNGLNGGLDKVQSVDENNNFSTHPNNAFVHYNSNSNQRLFKTDLLMTYSGIINKHKFNLNLFTNENEYDLLLYTPNPDNNDSLINSREKYTNRNTGLTLNSQFIFNDNLSIDLGGNYLLNDTRNLEYKKIAYHDYAIFGIFNLDLGPLSIEPGVRLFSKYDNLSVVYGSNFNYILNDHIFRLDISNSENTYLIADNVEKHFLGILEYRFKQNNYFLNSSLFFRNIDNPLDIKINTDEILTNQNDKLNIYGININSKFKLLNKLFYQSDYVNSTFKFDLNLGDIEYVPLFSSQLGFNWNFSRGRSTAKIGFKYRYNSKYKPKTFIPNAGFIQQNEEISNSNILDIFVLLKLGHAHLKLNYISLLGLDYYTAYLYPKPNNYLQITASWTITP